MTCLRLKVQDLRFKVQGTSLRFRILGFKVQYLDIRVQDFKVYHFRFRV